MPKLRERLGGAAGAETDQATAGAMAAAAAAQQAGAQAGGGGRGGRGGRGGGRGGFGGQEAGFGGRAGGRGAACSIGCNRRHGKSGSGGRTSARFPECTGSAPPSKLSLLPRPLRPRRHRQLQRIFRPEFDDTAGDEALLVSGSTSGGLAQSGMDEATRQRMIANAGGRGGGGGGGGCASAALDSSALTDNLGMPAGMMAPTNDTLGLGGFGVAAINGGFRRRSGWRGRW